MNNDYPRFKLKPEFVATYKNIRPPFGFDGLGEFTFYRTYSRVKPDGTNEAWYEVVERVVNETYSLQKRHSILTQRPWSEDKAERSAEEMFDRMFNMKFLPPGRGLWAMGSPVTAEREIYMALQNCFAQETEIITRDGIKTFKDLKDLKTVELLSENGEWIESEIKSFGVQPLKKITFRRAGIEKIVYATANHRWFAKSKSDVNHNKGWQTYTTDELVEGTRMRYFFSRSNHVAPSHTGIQHGFVFGDGGETSAFFAKGKDEDMLKYFRNQEIQERSFGFEIPRQPKFFKKLPDISESTNYLMGWLMGYFAADGSCQANGQCVISSSKKENIEFVRSVASVLGIGYHAILEDTRDTNFKEGHTTYSISLMRDTLTEDFFILSHHRENFRNNEIKQKVYWNVASVEETDRVEEVYCAVVPGTESFALADNLATYNCAFISTKDVAQKYRAWRNNSSGMQDPVEDYSRISPAALPFIFLMDVSMLGVGCGFDTKGAGQILVQSPNGIFSEPYVIPDSREGWVRSVEMVLNAYFYGDVYPKFDYSSIRPAGLPIKGFGGISSGPKPLIQLHKNLTKVLGKNIGMPLTSRTIVDIMNMIGQMVVAGNVRRTAELAIGDPEDQEYLDLKNYAVNPERANFGWTSNNSIDAKIGMNYSDAANRSRINGEPGYIWMENAKTRGRFMDAPVPDPAEGFNPCVEQPLESGEVCTLVETFPANHESLEDYKRTLKYAYLYAKSVTLAPIHWDMTNKIVAKNRRIGTSMTGIIQAIEKFGMKDFVHMADEGYNEIRRWDQMYSEWLGIPESIRVTTVKPSGTVSLLAGATPGLHRAESEYYIRRVRLAKNSPLLDPVRDAGYHVENSVSDPEHTVVVSFPVRVQNVGRTISQSNISEQFELAALLQKIWSDNGVSVTVTFRPEDEGDRIEELLNEYQHHLKAISLLPKLEGGAFPQMPYEEITKERYEEMSAGLMPVDFSKLHDNEGIGETGCANDVCEIKFG
jgi:ribonucleotide reductase alpha subunit